VRRSLLTERDVRDAARGYGIAVAATAEPRAPRGPDSNCWKMQPSLLAPACQEVKNDVLGLFKSLGYAVLDLDGVGRVSPTDVEAA